MTSRALQRAVAAWLPRLLAGAVSLVSASLAGCCLLAVPDLIANQQRMSGVEPRWAGIAVLAVVVAIAAALATVRVSARRGPGGPVVVSAGCGLLALLLSEHVASAPRLVGALLVGAVAVGGLGISGVAVAQAIRSRWVAWPVAGWVLALGCGLPLIGWLPRRDLAAHASGWGIHPPGWALVAAVVALAAWGVWCAARPDVLLGAPPAAVAPESPALLRGSAPVRGSAPDRRALAVRIAIGAAVSASFVLATILGFRDGVSASWARPLVMLAGCLAVAAVGAALATLPVGRGPALTLVVAFAGGPIGCQVVAVTTLGVGGRLDALWQVGLVLAVSGCVGALLGWLTGPTGMSAGLTAMVLGVALAWPMSAHLWLLVPAAALLAGGFSCAVAAAGRAAAGEPSSLPVAAVGGLGSLLLVTLAVGPVTWSLGAPVDRPTDTAAGGRVVLGLCFAALVVSAAWLVAFPAADTAQGADGDSSAVLGVRAADDSQTNRSPVSA